MYNNHFGFDRKPFKPKDPRDYYRNADFDAACATVLQGIRAWRGIILLTGETGLGKSFVLQRCMAEAAEVRFIPLSHAALDFADILNVICADLGLRDETLAGGQRQLAQAAFTDHAERDQALALVIDDAHQLHSDVLRQLWAFVEATATRVGQRLPVILAGWPELERQMEQLGLYPSPDAPQLVHRLEPLSALETGLFISHQLQIAGYPDTDGFWSPAVIERIAQYCQGVPRAIALLCDAILLFASLESKREITPALVDEAAQSCFFSEATPNPSRSVASETAPGRSAADLEDPFDFAEAGLDFDLDFDFDDPADARHALADENTEPLLAAESTPNGLEARVVDPQVPDADPVSGVASASSDTPLEAQAASAVALREFLQLLDEIVTQQNRTDPRDTEAFRGFRQWFLGAMYSDSPLGLARCEQRMAQLAAQPSPLWVALAATPRVPATAGGVLSILLVNASWWLYREIRVRLHSMDLEFANQGQAMSLRLLDGRHGRPVYLEYRTARNQPAPATLRLELDLLDHRGLWHAYQTDAILLAPPLDAGAARAPQAAPATEASQDQFWPLAAPLRGGSDTAIKGEGSSGPVFTLPLALTLDDERTRRLRAAANGSSQMLTRGTALTRALLLVADSTQAPARIELVSRPFFTLGRYNPATGAGLGDFALGFTSDQARISRLHAVVCALGDQLTLMPASERGQTYTARNGERLTCGQWYSLASNDSLGICGLYQLKLSLAWDRHDGYGQRPVWNIEEPRGKFGRYVLDLVERLRQRDRRVGDDESRIRLRKRYLNLLWIQDRVARLNGVGSPGALLYARFERDDTSRQIVHYYVPKWLSLGSSPRAGLTIAAADVAPLHAELLFREGMYWIQNLAGPGSVQVGCHGLETNEVMALEAGDTLSIGAARFEFEAY